MMVTSRPGRLTSASPSGIAKPGSVGTRPFRPCSRMVSTNRHGSGSKIAEVSRPLAVPRSGRDDDLQAGDVHEPRLERLRVGGPGAEAAVDLRADGDRRRRAACRHEAQLRRMVDDLVGRDADEVHDHDLGHRQQAVDRRTDRGAEDRGLRDRGVQHPVVAVLGGQSRGRAGGAGIGDVLAEQEHPLVGGQRLVQSEVQRLAHGHLGLGHGLLLRPGTRSGWRRRRVPTRRRVAGRPP